LDPEQRRRVERHLADCASCSESLRLDLAIASHALDHPLESLETHVSAELLAEFATRPRSLEDHERRRIEAHLAECDACSSAEAIVREMQTDLESSRESPAEDARPISISGRLWQRLTATVLRPELALAYLLLLIAVPVYRQWIAPQRVGLPIAPQATAGPVEIQFLTSAARGTAEVSPVRVGSADGPVYIGFEPQLPPDGDGDGDLAVEVTSTNRVVWRLETTSAAIRRAMRSDQAAFVIAIPAALVPPGRYTLRVRRLDSNAIGFEQRFVTIRELSSSEDPRIDEGQGDPP
jgi:anti-sigma factor RsiW